MTKMRQDNNVTDHTSLLFTKIKIEPSWTIQQGTVYDKYEMG